MNAKADTHPEDLLTWADGTTAERSDYDRGDYNFMSDDFTVTPVDQRVDHFDEDISIPQLYEQLSIALKSMKCNAVIHFDNDEICLELGVTNTSFTQDFESALKRVASAVILKEMPDAPTGVRAFGDVLIDPLSGITFWGWKVGAHANEEIADEDGRWINPVSLAEAPAPAEIDPCP